MKSHRISTVVIEARDLTAAELSARLDAAVNEACEAIEADGGRIILPIGYQTMQTGSTVTSGADKASTEWSHTNVVIASIGFEKQR